jgi:Trypsin-co-occurring domain 2
MSGVTFNQLIKTIEDALEIVAKKGKDKFGITLMKAELEVSISATDKMSAGVKVDWGVSIDLGGETESTDAHVLSLTLLPVNKVLKLGTQKNDLADAILELAKAISETDQTKFAVKEGVVDVSFMVNSAGNLKVVVGTSTKKEGSHRIKLTFQPSSAA